MLQPCSANVSCDAIHKCDNRSLAQTGGRFSSVCARTCSVCDGRSRVRLGWSNTKQLRGRKSPTDHTPYLWSRCTRRRTSCTSRLGWRPETLWTTGAHKETAPRTAPPPLAATRQWAPQSSTSPCPRLASLATRAGQSSASTRAGTTAAAGSRGGQRGTDSASHSTTRYPTPWPRSTRWETRTARRSLRGTGCRC